MNVSDLARYSGLSVRRIQQAYGFNYQFSDRWALTWLAYHGQYKDRTAYLFDTNGRNMGVQAGLSLIF